jgi:hypothetical protein
MNVTYVTSFSEKYFNSTAQYSLPSWKHFKGDKIAMVDGTFSPAFTDIKIISSDVAFDKNDIYFQTTGKKLKFWRKGMCFAWAAKNIKTDYLVWIDSDVKAYKDFDFEKFKPDDSILATMISANKSHAETGFVIMNRKHPSFENWLYEYKNGWYNGLIDQVPAPWDGYIFWETIKNYPHINLAKNTIKGPQGFEDTDLLEFMFHYSGKGRKHLIKG